MMYIAIGGSIGAILRYGFIVFAKRFTTSTFPFYTILINILGSFLFGYFIQQTSSFIDFICVGILGGFTTFSSFIMESIELLEKKAPIQSLIYLISTIILSFFACFLGILIGGF